MMDIQEGLGEHFGFIRGNLLVLSISSGLWRMASHLVNPFFPLYVLALGGSYVSIGIISAVGGILTIFPTFIGGWLADTRSRKKIVGLMTVCMGPIKLIQAFATSWIHLLVAFALNSVFSSIRGPAFSAIIADSLKPENRGKGYGVWSSLPTILAIGSPTLGGWLITQLGLIKALRIGYVLVAIAATTAGFLRFFFLRETFQEEERKEEGLKESLASTLRSTRRYPTTLKALLIVNMLAIFGWGIKRRYRVVFAEEVIGLSEFYWGILFTMARMIRIATLPFLGRYVDKKGRRLILLLTLGLIPLMDVLFVHAIGFYSAFLAFTGFYISRHVRATSIKALRADLSPKKKRGEIYSIFRVLIRPSRNIAPLLGGVLYTLHTRFPFYAEAIINVGLIFVVFFLMKEPKEREE